MTMAKIALLPDRGVVSVMGDDARKLLQGVITNDMAAFDQGVAAIHAGLLTPQGKILFEFFVAAVPGGFLLETAADRVADLVKRLTLYKLRAAADISDVSERFKFLALWGKDHCSSGETVGTVSFRDPRHPLLGLRILAEGRFATDIASATNGRNATPAEYDDHRISLGVPQGGRDYALGDTFPHEADFDLLAGVSFTKGCFVGQEVVARMENKSVVRKRVVGVTGAGLASGVEVRLGEVTIGSVGTVAGQQGLALVRLDRVVEALDGGLMLSAGGQPVVVDPAAVDRDRRSVAEKAAGP